MSAKRRSTLAPATDPRFPIPLRGVEVDAQTRCAHYDGLHDIIALRSAGDETFAPCHQCHEATTGQPFQPWPADRFDEPAVYCGACRETLTATEYLASPEACPRCGTAFNPGCAAHHELYFEIAPELVPG
ncbi:MAG: hypothetical protein AAGI52_16310 [Bacteroidota bacterium]